MQASVSHEHTYFPWRYLFSHTLMSRLAFTILPLSGSNPIAAASENAGHSGFFSVKTGTWSSSISRFSSRFVSFEARLMLAMICFVMSSFIFLLLGSFLRSLAALLRLSRISSAHFDMSWAVAVLMSSLASLMALRALSMEASVLALSSTSSSWWWVSRKSSSSSESSPPYSRARLRSLTARL